MKWTLICLLLLYVKLSATQDSESDSSGGIETGSVNSNSSGKGEGGGSADTNSNSQTLSLAVGVDATITTAGVGGNGEADAAAAVSVKVQETTESIDTSTKVTVTTPVKPPSVPPPTEPTLPPPVTVETTPETSSTSVTSTTVTTPPSTTPSTTVTSTETPPPSTTSSTTVTSTETPPPPSPPTTTPPTTTQSKPPPPPNPSKPPHRCSVCELDDFMGFGFTPGKCGCCPWPCCCKCIKKSGKQGPCRELLDLAFIVDASGSIGSIDWDTVKSFLSNAVSELTDVGKGQHVAAITFSTEAKLKWNLDSVKTSTLENLQNALKNLANVGGFTNTADAIEIATKRVFTDPPENPKAANVAVILTDGRANFRTDEIADLSRKLRDKATTICIAVTDEVNDDELRMMCDEDKIHRVSQFDKLPGILDKLQTEICPKPPVSEKCYCCCTPEMFFGDQGDGRYYW